jgi:rhodanese-related sulfurtransferase
MRKRTDNIFQQLESFENEITRLERTIVELEERLLRMNAIDRNHLIRVKNGEDLSDEFIAQGLPYRDLSPEKAWQLYHQKDFNFILVDVSENSPGVRHQFPEAIHLPWSEFKARAHELINKQTPILIISEDGTTSILACEVLSKRGFFNCCNVSGGHEFWGRFRLDLVESA